MLLCFFIQNYIICILVCGNDIVLVLQRTTSVAEKNVALIE